ncbi:Rossmann-fold NAD(P)-binding domain-containing protein [Staphylococcus epidermidis]|nr:hypothetical protein [Staphylococcus epidermidis]
MVEEGLDKYGELLKGFRGVGVDKVGNGFIKSVEGGESGERYKVY